jgi:DDE superfamily endonuclease
MRQESDTEVPEQLKCYVVLDNASTYKTAQVQRWLTAHRRFVLHSTPTSSGWVNLVERCSAELTSKKACCAHTSVRQLKSDIGACMQTLNDNPRPYVWTETADQSGNPPPFTVPTS